MLIKSRKPKKSFGTMLKDLGKKLAIKPAWDNAKKGVRVRRNSIRMSMPDLNVFASHKRAASLRPLPTVPVIPAAPRSLHARRPTGPRELPAVVQTQIEKRTGFEDVKEGRLFIKPAEKSINTAISSLVCLLDAYVSCEDKRIVEAVKDKLTEITTLTQEICVNLN
jgi:hypothetical protein